LQLRRQAAGDTLTLVRIATTKLRCGIPIAAGVVLMFLSLFAGAVLTWVMLTAAFGLLLDGATIAWERSGATGGLSDHRQ
jgi:hypothetical protein